IALALGPVMGGYIVAYWGWRWIFFINIPIVILGFLFCLKSVKESMVERKDRDLDYLGMIFIMLTMGGLVLGIIHAETQGWTDPLTFIFLVVGIISGITLFKIETKKENPLIDFADFSKLLFYCGAMMCMLAGVMSACALFFDPIYLQVILGQTPEYSGLVLFIIPIAVFLVAFLVGWLIHSISIIPTIIVGMTLSVLAGVLQIFFSHLTPLWFIIIAFIFLGGMWAIGNTASVIAGQVAVGQERASSATGTIVTMFNIGGSLGLAIAVVIYHWRSNAFLNHLFSQQNISTEELSLLQKTLDNPTGSMHVSMSDATHALFNSAFIHGFTSVMWFLFALSFVTLLSVLIWKLRENRI
ncbi:MAG TPA: MFS transporter, partial [Gammaproteobacteria bacterium]|nr:MFS transporter [Gammaproteobacteria bacterium]